MKVRPDNVPTKGFINLPRTSDSLAMLFIVVNIGIICCFAERVVEGWPILEGANSGRSNCNEVSCNLVSSKSLRSCLKMHTSVLYAVSHFEHGWNKSLPFTLQSAEETSKPSADNEYLDARLCRTHIAKPG